MRDFLNRHAGVAGVGRRLWRWDRTGLPNVGAVEILARVTIYMMNEHRRMSEQKARSLVRINESRTAVFQSRLRILMAAAPAQPLNWITIKPASPLDRVHQLNLQFLALVLVLDYSLIVGPAVYLTSRLPARWLMAL